MEGIVLAPLDYITVRVGSKRPLRLGGNSEAVAILRLNITGASHFREDVRDPYILHFFSFQKLQRR